MNMFHDSHLAKRTLTIALLLALACTACDTPKQTTRQATVDQTHAETDNFTIAVDYLDRFSEHEAAYGQRNMLFRLNAWLEEQDSDPAWEVDRLARQIPRAYQATPEAQQYDRLSFDTLDGWTLWEAAMMKRVSTWALDGAHDDPLLADWYKAMEGTHGADHAHRLRMAANLFDWTVRNIQLDPLLNHVPAGVTGPAEAGTNQQAMPAAMRGIPGPGYRFEPWQVLLYGRGDAWQRARIFIRLARQQNLEVVMLAIDDPSLKPSPRPWAPALLLEGELYLFDTTLGIPIPATGGEGIARLAEVIADPEILRQCDWADETYPVEAKHLKGIEALIDATPAELSQRMSLVEANLTGRQKLDLTVDPSTLATRLRETGGVSNVRVWPIGIEAHLYRQKADKMIMSNRDLYVEYIVREAIFATPNPVALARWQHLAGNFDTSNERPGAKQLYLEARHSESTIAIMAESPPILRKLGLTEGLSDDPNIRQEQLSRVKVMLTQSAHNASYWLGLINYDEGKFPVALTWFERQTLEGQSQTVWDSGAGYNVGRSLEQMNEYEKALATYQTQPKSPSLPGQLVRAKLIEERFGK